jgi:hypothetical protein
VLLRAYAVGPRTEFSIVGKKEILEERAAIEVHRLIVSFTVYGVMKGRDVSGDDVADLNMTPGSPDYVIAELFAQLVEGLTQRMRCAVIGTVAPEQRFQRIASRTAERGDVYQQGKTAALSRELRRLSVFERDVRAAQRRDADHGEALWGSVSQWCVRPPAFASVPVAFRGLFLRANPDRPWTHRSEVGRQGYPKFS